MYSLTRRYLRMWVNRPARSQSSGHQDVSAVTPFPVFNPLNVTAGRREMWVQVVNQTVKSTRRDPNSPFTPPVPLIAEAKATTRAWKIRPLPLKITGPYFYCVVANNVQSLRQIEGRSVSSRRVPLSLCSICKRLGMIPEESVTTLAADLCQSLCRPTVRWGLLLSLESYLAWSHACVESRVRKKGTETPQRGNTSELQCYCVFFFARFSATHIKTIYLTGGEQNPMHAVIAHLSSSSEVCFVHKCL